MRLPFITAAMVLALSASVAQAAPPDITARVVPGIGKVAHQVLFEATSREGETLDQFALRMAPELRKFSDETGYEACGVLAEENNDGARRYGVVVGTNFSHVFCANFRALVPEGMEARAETIHSHGGAKSFRASRMDRIFLEATMDGKSGYSMTGRQSPMVYGQDLAHFSEVDFAGGAGYLATPQGVAYQNGAQLVRHFEPQEDVQPELTLRVASVR